MKHRIETSITETPIGQTGIWYEYKAWYGNVVTMSGIRKGTKQSVTNYARNAAANRKRSGSTLETSKGKGQDWRAQSAIKNDVYAQTGENQGIL